MAALDTPNLATELRAVKAQANGTLVDFDEEALRSVLVRAAGKKLSAVAKSGFSTKRATRNALPSSDSARRM